MNRALLKYGLNSLLLATVLLAGACGIKPKNLDAPAGAEDNGFPRDYPQE